ncbi:glycosyltransferase family 9 protein [Actinoalloteichus caeruleus]|uniref:ADP-heptose:LPS heptosyltransferase n=1 Tax=Actinoalloteichus caeruleus DSM 43889 TaxID=1120930 RepID=A0ABT1JCF2_ACTCY|nr:glycosyltransferase family 9 protein [Actinoalloteichus caeruleus]MCP2329836.1 ADP-heptose:LPS heptosyltransferase [Actinoalloteichus caeruleus DSM 43889]
MGEHDAGPALPPIGPAGGRWPDVGRIGVLRGGGIGDLMFVMPALVALRAAYPEAELVLLGTGAHRALLAGRPGPVDRCLPLPRAHGVHEPTPGQPDDGVDQGAFLASVAALRLDLGAQLHGGGRWSNPFLLRTGARHTVGTATPDAEPLERTIPYRYYQHEVLRHLEVVGLAGAPPVVVDPALPVTDGDRDRAASALSGLPEPLLVVHPGATDPRRRWPPPLFAEVVERVVRDGAGAVVLGSSNEEALVRGTARLARERLPAGLREQVREFPGTLDLSGMVGVLASARVVLANDSGPRHVAQAVGTATVGVFQACNVINAAALGRARHPVHFSWFTRCPRCGVLAAGPEGARCAHEFSMVGDVPVVEVLADVRELLGGPTGSDRGGSRDRQGSRGTGCQRHSSPGASWTSGVGAHRSGFPAGENA